MSFHELIIHSPDHHKNFDELPLSQTELVFQTYRERYNAHLKHGQIYLFHNRGIAAGESLPHPHTQLTVVPSSVRLDIVPLDIAIYGGGSGIRHRLLRKLVSSTSELLETEHFFIFCPRTSQWPDEVWIAPKRKGLIFGQSEDAEIKDLAFCVSRLVQILSLRYGHEFPFNFYIYPGAHWYLKLIPRVKILGGFEVGTGVFVNTQDPLETFAFIKELFWEPNSEKIEVEHQAEYWRSV